MSKDCGEMGGNNDSLGTIYGLGNEKDFALRMAFLGFGESLPNKALTLESQGQNNQVCIFWTDENE